jgi:hypothetical protein
MYSLVSILNVVFTHFHICPILKEAIVVVCNYLCNQCLSTELTFFVWIRNLKCLPLQENNNIGPYRENILKLVLLDYSNCSFYKNAWNSLSSARFPSFTKHHVQFGFNEVFSLWEKYLSVFTLNYMLCFCPVVAAILGFERPAKSLFKKFCWRKHDNCDCEFAQLSVFLWCWTSCGVVVISSSAVDRGFESRLKQQSAGRHVAPLGHIIQFPSQPIFVLSP